MVATNVYDSGINWFLNSYINVARCIYPKPQDEDDIFVADYSKLLRTLRSVVSEGNASGEIDYDPNGDFDETVMSFLKGKFVSSLEHFSEEYKIKFSGIKSFKGLISPLELWSASSGYISKAVSDLSFAFPELLDAM